MAEAKQVVSPEQAADVPAPVAVNDNRPVKATVVFWKRVNPFEKIVFKDGTHTVFGRQTFATADEALIEKIEAVADSYGIFRQ